MAEKAWGSFERDACVDFRDACCLWGLREPNGGRWALGWMVWVVGQFTIYILVHNYSFYHFSNYIVLVIHNFSSIIINYSSQFERRVKRDEYDFGLFHFMVPTGM